MTDKLRSELHAALDQGFDEILLNRPMQDNEKATINLVLTSASGIELKVSRTKPVKRCAILPLKPIREKDWQAILSADLHETSRTIIRMLHENGNQPIVFANIMIHSRLQTVNRCFRSLGMPFRVTNTIRGAHYYDSTYRLYHIKT